MKVVKGVRTRLHLGWDMGKDKHYLYLDNQKICKLTKKQWWAISNHFAEGEK